MKTKLKTIPAIFLFLVLAMHYKCAQAQQNYYPVLSMEVQTTHIDGDSTANGMVDISDTTVFNTHMLISLFDTSNISKLHVKFGRTTGSGDLLQKDFVFDVFGNLGDGTTYIRNGYNIDLNLGDYLDILKYYAEVKIENGSGNLTDAVVYSR